MTNERCVEVPWCLARLHGPTLDVGAAESDYLARLPPGSVAIDVRPPRRPVPDHVAYLLADATALPFVAGAFPHVLCLSTFEHLGRHHSPYGTSVDATVPARALDELWRVLAPGGTLLVTVPYGRREDHGWFLNYDRAALRDDFGGLPRPQATYFAAPDWRGCQPAELVDVSYRPHEGRAGAVACLAFTKGASDRWIS